MYYWKAGAIKAIKEAKVVYFGSEIGTPDAPCRVNVRVSKAVAIRAIIRANTPEPRQFNILIDEEDGSIIIGRGTIKKVTGGIKVDIIEVTFLDTGETFHWTRMHCEMTFGKPEFAEIEAGYIPNIVAVQIS